MNENPDAVTPCKPPPHQSTNTRDPSASANSEASLFPPPKSTESETRHSPVERKTAAADPRSALASSVNPISRKHAGFGPRYAKVTATFSHPRSLQTRRAFTFIADVENHFHGISGRQRTASYSFFPIPDTDKEGCGGMRFFERELPRHLSVSRILLRPSVFVIVPPPSPANSSLHS